MTLEWPTSVLEAARDSMGETLAWVLVSVLGGIAALAFWWWFYHD
jgi:hypothetical protein